MSAESIMQRQPVTLSADDTVARAMELLLDHRFRTLPVVDRDGRFLGLFGVHRLLQLLLPKAATVPGGLTTLTYVHDTLEDLRTRLREVSGESVGRYIHERAKEVKETPVKHYLEDDVTVVRPDTSIMETLLVLYHTYNSVPVVEEESGRLVGIVSYWDIFRKIAGRS